MIQRIIGWVLLGLGLSYGAAILLLARRDRELLRGEAGRFPLLCALEVPIYFLATLGISDFLLHTLVLKRARLTDDERIPGTLVAAGVTPGAVIAFTLLRAGTGLALQTLLLCCAGIVLGSVLGARLVRRLDSARIRRVMAFALLGAMAALILKMIVSAGAAGTAVGLEPWKLAVAAVFSVFWGVMNMLGVPMKPAATAVFLLLGLSPLATLTLVLVMGCLGPMGGGVEVLRGGRYHRKTACAAVLCGSVGAVLGGLFTVSVDPTVLNILMLVMMLAALISMLKK